MDKALGLDLYFVEKNMVDTVWPDAAELLARIKQVGEEPIDLDFWKAKLNNEEAQLWVVTDASQLVQFVLVTPSV